MSRLPRAAEHLKTGFTAEAVSAARCRAHARQAERDGRPNLAAAWDELAREKDRLAILQLEAAGQVRDTLTAVVDALGEEEFENDVLYPKMIRQVDAETADVFRQVVQAQQEHASRLERLHDRVQAATEDIPA